MSSNISWYWQSSSLVYIWFVYPHGCSQEHSTLVLYDPQKALDAPLHKKYLFFSPCDENWKSVVDILCLWSDRLVRLNSTFHQWSWARNQFLQYILNWGHCLYNYIDTYSERYTSPVMRLTSIDFSITTRTKTLTPWHDPLTPDTVIAWGTSGLL